MKQRPFTQRTGEAEQAGGSWRRQAEEPGLSMEHLHKLEGARCASGTMQKRDGGY